MLSWAASWLGSGEVMSARLYSEEVLDECDFRIVKQLWNLLNEADIVVAHNGNAFDIPKIRARFALNGLPPTSFYQQIDTKITAAKEFGFSSNKLDALINDNLLNLLIEKLEYIPINSCKENIEKLQMHQTSIR